MTNPVFELYGFWRSSATYRVRVALALKGLAAKEIQVNLEDGEQFAPAFLAINPQGTLPALVQPDHPPLTQSMAIMEYLEEQFPLPPLLPAGAHARARVRALAASMASDTHPLIVPRVRKYLTGPGGLDATAWRAWQTTWFTRGLQSMENRLYADAATGAFCHGDHPTMADICLMSVVAVAKVFKIEVADIPTLDRIIARCNDMEPFARAEPALQPGSPREI
ncbi:maleylacetoacetate isomerase [Acidisoma cellulosilytica]|uniref:Maleylacetoacetate isomerase n=1 Tax=Acidisoma cellulosilyticum TaxID=2802395 RepID=A0A964E723_9PROT|nr:maleylacetoacetate isomerase [Acidisoma cellulosilyticum]MCB8884087.1 maleylacetoacetate isomerase [Acidisoma cellulosilyticum]